MVIINGYDIELTRGDTLFLRIDLSGRDLPEGTDAVFTVKKSVYSDEVLLRKRFDAADEVVAIRLSSYETRLEPGTYVWDIRLQIPQDDGRKEIYTPMEYAAFVVLESVGEPVDENNPDIDTDVQLAIREIRVAVEKVKAGAEEAAANAETAAETARAAAAEADRAVLSIDQKVEEAAEEIAEQTKTLDGKLSELSEEINEARGYSVNLFNASSEKIRKDTYIANSGYASLADCVASHPIFMKQGCTYQYPHDNSTFGGNRRYAVCDADTGDVLALDVPATSEDGVFNLITPLTDMWVAVNVGQKMDAFMVCEASKYPESYVPYGKTTVKDGIVQTVEKALPEIMPPITPEMTTFLEPKESENLFDKSNVVSGGYYQPYSGALVADNKMFHCLIPVKAGVYSFAGASSYYGNSTASVPLFDASENFVTSVVGVMGSSLGNGLTVATYTITDDLVEQGAVYAGYSVYKDNLNTAMYVNSGTYPDEYIAYGKLIRMPKLRIEQKNASFAQINPLYGKTAVFDGDSICAGDGNGWSGRIGTANQMNWKNVSVGGGTITSELYKDDVARHWLSAYIDTIHANYPELDYLILEGGTNDADLLSDDQIGTLDPNDFSGGYDATTFYGALDTLFYKALSYYPKAKIGFIIAQRMGTGTSVQAKRRAFFDRIIEACIKWAIPYIDLWHCGQLNPNLLVHYDPNVTGSAAAEAGKAYLDGQHLTSVGYDMISSKIEAWMRTL